MCAAVMASDTTSTWKVCAKKFNTTTMSDSEKDGMVWTNASVKVTGKINCDGSTYKYYDQLISELYDEGYRVFINEIGRGYDDEINNNPYFYCSSEDGCINKDLAMCLIVFGNYKKSSYDKLRDLFPKLKIIEAEFYFDDEFATQFVEWFNEYTNRDKIIMEFIDMTVGNVEPAIEILKKCKVSPRILRISKILYGKEGNKTYSINGTNFGEIELKMSTPHLKKIIESLYGSGRYYKKYLKYKAKYLKLKYSI